MNLKANSTYHNSPVKKKNQAFKLKWAKRALRQSQWETSHALTLCGNNLDSEITFYEYAKAKGMPLHIESFNMNEPELREAQNQKDNYPNRTPIYLNHKTMRPKHLQENTVYVDFDTCNWFLDGNAKIASNAAMYCDMADCVALTIIIKGDSRCQEIWRLPEGMTNADVKNPKAIGAWLENNSPLYLLDIQEYRNYYSSSTMATIIMGKKSDSQRKQSPAYIEARSQALAMHAKGINNKSIANILGVKQTQVGAWIAWLSPSLQCFRTNK